MSGVAANSYPYTIHGAIQALDLIKQVGLEALEPRIQLLPAHILNYVPI